jgi:hypothetical protein
MQERHYSTPVLPRQVGETCKNQVTTLRNRKTSVCCQLGGLSIRFTQGKIDPGKAFCPGLTSKRRERIAFDGSALLNVYTYLIL